ncbi:MAG: hypothetical protein ACLP7Q_08070 [Isosphaeraceae bacterium]
MEDIPQPPDHFLTQAARACGRPKRRSTLAGVQQLQRYHAPGNVRELQPVLERAVITADGALLVIELPAGSVGRARRARSMTEIRPIERQESWPATVLDDPT